VVSAAGDQVPSTLFYAASIIAAGLAEAAVWLYAMRIRELALPGTPPTVHRWVLLRTPMTPAVFLVSVPVAVFQPVLAKYLWLLLIPAGELLRRLEPPEGDPEAADGADQPG
jgi:hypothetical protein